ncbi:hypothetical protein KKH36_01080 [Patescibacteria group bacterium]|nr:hypothetical protein [Patescibacteria group bacterium]
MAENQKTKMTLWEVLEKKCREAFPTLREFLEKELGVKTHLYGPREDRNDGDFYFYGYEGITKEAVMKTAYEYYSEVLGEEPQKARVLTDLLVLRVKESRLVVVGPLYSTWPEEFKIKTDDVFEKVA